MKTPWRRLEDVFRLGLQKTSSRRLQDEYILINHTSSEDVFKTSSRRFQEVFRTSSRRFQDIFKISWKNVFKTPSRHIQDVLKTSSRHLANTSWRHLRRLQDVFKTYHQVKPFLLASLWEVLKMFVKRTAKTVVYRRIHLGDTSKKFMVSVQNLQE